MKNLASKLALSAVLLVGGLIFTGCTPFVSQKARDSLVREVQKKDAIIGFEGLWTPMTIYAVDKSTRQIAEKTAMASLATSSYDDDYLEIVRAANQSGHDVYVVAHSLGSVAAGKLARECRKRGLKIRKIYALDAFSDGGNVPENIEYKNIHSSENYLFGKQMFGRGECVNIPNSNHFNLPEKSREYILEDITR